MFCLKKFYFLFLFSPAGAAIGIPLTKIEAQSYFVSDLSIDSHNPSLAAAYSRARGNIFIYIF